MMNVFFDRLGTPRAGYAYWFLCAGLVLIGLATLKISPLPWYDEVDFASITRNYMNNGTMNCEANNLYFGLKEKEVLYYGPVYFVLSSLIMKWIGFGIMQFRLLNFLSGIVCVFLFIRLFERLSERKCKGVEKALFALLMFSDYTYTQDMHSGRMDLLALMFTLFGLLWADISSQKFVRNFFLSGFFIAAGLLTTPRVYFLVLPYFGYLLYLYVMTRKKHILAGIVLATATTCLLYMGWIFGKFGSIQSYIDYLNTPTTLFDTAAGDFFIVNTNFPGYQVIYYVILLALGVWVGMKKYRALLLPVNVISLLTIALFLLLAGGSVIYMCFITGFIYILAVKFSDAATGNRNVAIVLVVLLNFGMLGYKYAVILKDYRERNPEDLNQWVSHSIKPGTKVVGDDKYYYAVLNAQSKFQYYQRGGTVNERVAYHKERWNPDYLLVEDTSTLLFRAYRNNMKLVFQAEYGAFREREFSENKSLSNHGFLFRFLH